MHTAQHTFFERVLDVLDLGGDELNVTQVRTAVLRRVRQALLPHDDQSEQWLLLDVHLLRNHLK